MLVLGGFSCLDAANFQNYGDFLIGYDRVIHFVPQGC